MMSHDFPAVFERLRSILKQHAGEFVVSEDSPTRYCLEAPVGPATLQAWRGKKKRELIPVAWTEIGKAYVSFHHMALPVSSKLREGMSDDLSKRMQGKTCFNFRSESEVPVSELEMLTARGCAAMRAAGFII
jgi:hypothetical protein